MWIFKSGDWDYRQASVLSRNYDDVSLQMVDYERDRTKYRSDQVRTGPSDSIENYKKQSTYLQSSI